VLCRPSPGQPGPDQVKDLAGQVAYHLLIQAGMTRAPWEVTTLVSCLPVLVLGLGSALAHLLRSDASAARTQVGTLRLNDHAARKPKDLAPENPNHRRGRLLRQPARLRLAEAHTAAERLIEDFLWLAQPFSASVCLQPVSGSFTHTARWEGDRWHRDTAGPRSSPTCWWRSR
jgi:hypothetical protein